ncbi:LexA family protein [Shouchella lehensis]|nr:XRE family transcriptional regulator [Shouchella lehensis]MBG9783563.1 hypothetical protein [Shouchella lehensis]
MYDKETFAQNLRHYMKKNNVKSSDLAEYLNVAKSTVSGYTKLEDSRQPDFEKLFKISELLNVSISKLLGQETNDELNTEEKQPSLVEIPILGTVRAGYNLLADENIVGYDYARKSNIGDGQYFYLTIEGSSMIDAGLTPGTRILVRKQDYVTDGSIAVVLINGEEATVKRVFFDNDKIILTPENRSLRPTFHNPEDINFLGKVISYTATLD